MPITATYTAAQFKLGILGSTDPESIVISRNPAGTLFVNAGAVPVTGGPATVANTSLIEAAGDAGADTIALDETNGALPVAELSGGGGDDMLTGGSGGDTLAGEGDNDTLLGKGGSDLLYGGAGNDTLTGGDADDQMFGEDGNDRMIWNPGDDTDLMEGGNDSDTAEVNGGNGTEVFSVTANGTRVRFDRLDPAPFALDIGTTETLVVNMNGGDDSISATGNLAALISLRVDGGTGNDTILASNGADVLEGGDGNDFVDGNQGNDTAFLGTGNDTFQWDPGDGSDVVEGQADTDVLLFNASAANEVIELSANGARALLTRNVGNIVMDLNGVETFAINALAGADTLTVNDLSGTDATAVTLNLSGTIGGTAGDGAADSVVANGTNGTDVINVVGSGTSVNVLGLTASLTATSTEGANDSLTVNGLGGDDNITATTLPAGVIKLTLDGGAANDTIFGSQGADTFFGGDGNDFVFGDNGNDVAFLGAGADVFQWEPGDGNDVVEGQANVDELRFVGSNASESVGIAANGGRIVFSRDVALVAIDLDDVEMIRFTAIGGSDNIFVGDLTGTDATDIEIRLEGSGGGGDGAVDTVTVNSTNGEDVFAVSSFGGVVTVSGLSADVVIHGAEGANDKLTVNGQGGDDVINASVLAAGLVSLTVNAGLGADLLIGSDGADLFNGGDGNDTGLLGAGDDVAVWNPGDDNDTIEGQSGTDTLRFNGANVAETITITPNGGRVLFFRDIANVTMDLNDTEVIQFAALGGADTIVVDDLSGTDVTLVAIDLASTIGGASGDSLGDTLTLNASGVANTIVISGTTGALLTVTGLPASVTLSQFETSGVVDKLTIMAFGGNDNISATGLIPHIATLTIDGGVGHDTIRSNGDGTYLGGTGDDTIFAGLTSALEALDGGDGIDTLDTTSWGGLYTINMVTGATNYGGESFLNFENLITGAGADTVTGTDAANVIRTNGDVDNIVGAGGNDTLDGGAGADTMTGGLGDDWFYVDDGGDVVIEGSGDGANDRILTSVNYTLGAGVYVERLTTTDNFGTDPLSLAGNELANLIYGNAGANVLSGMGGADTMVGFGGSDFYFVDNAADAVNEGALDGAFDRVIASVSYALGAGVHVEQMVTIDDAATTAINLTGNEIAQALIGNAGANVLDGKGGADTMNGQGGNDWYYVDNALDSVIEGVGSGIDRISASLSYTLAAGIEIEMLTTTDNFATTAINLTGNGFANTIFGNAGANILDGKGGVDSLIGFGGDDWYYVDNAADSVNEAVGGGTLDRIFSSVSYTLGATTDVERLSTVDNAGTAAINLTGNGIDNVMYGNAGANILDGRGGVDILIGLGGDDWYYVDNAADSINEVAGGGTLDRIFSSVSYTLGSSTDVERLSTTDNAGIAAINLTGNGIDNVMYGNAGANILDGRGGVDILIGLGGDDWYYVDNAADSINEVAGGGTLDRIFSSVSYTLGSSTDVERLSTTDNAGTAAINLTGNGIDNVMYGNAGANILDGRGGVDILIGLGGDDWYYVDNALDSINEVAGGGTLDRIFSSVSYTLAAGTQVERLSTTDNAGTAAINLTGNEIDNVMYGNAGANVLDGRGGVDILIGLGGDDWYFIDNAADAVNEGAGGGINDRILSSVSYALGAGVQVEILSTTDNLGTTALNFSGNELANSIFGNSGINILDGKGGSDALNGFAGADTFRFTTALGAGNVDAIGGYSVADDAIQLDDAVFAGLATGALAAGAFVTGAAAADADDRIIYNSATGALLFDADGVGGVAAVQFATLSTGLAMAASEFFVI